MVWKIDFIMRKPGAFSREAFRRRVPGDIQGVPVVISTAEDIILARLDWAKQGASQHQIEDVASILKIQMGRSIRIYLHRWIHELGLDFQWTSAKQAAGVAQNSLCL